MHQDEGARTALQHACDASYDDPNLDIVMLLVEQRAWELLLMRDDHLRTMHYTGLV